MFCYHLLNIRGNVVDNDYVASLWSFSRFLKLKLITSFYKTLDQAGEIPSIFLWETELQNYSAQSSLDRISVMYSCAEDWVKTNCYHLTQIKYCLTHMCFFVSQYIF